uniref:NADH-ubiquinone oxidoreductase chain 1 n=1 Tax=Felis catus TaxID=9685 RepID=A0ABI7ZL97_FELCA
MFIITNLSLIIPILLTIAFLTLVEPKLSGYIQLRKGPNIVGPYGPCAPILAFSLSISQPIHTRTRYHELYRQNPIPNILLPMNSSILPTILI